MVRRNGKEIILEMTDWEELVRLLSRTKNILESASNNLALSIMLIADVVKGEDNPEKLKDAIEGIQIVGDALIVQAEDILETVKSIGLAEVK
jgi:Ni2+-binding GTPase involved in maturation of urease and hydrogenase